MLNKPTSIKEFFSSTKKWLITTGEKFNVIWDPGFIFSNVLVPLVILLLYFLSLKEFLAFFSLEESVNYVLANRSLIYFSFPTLIILVYFLTLYFKKKSRITNLIKPSKRIAVKDILLLLLPLTPITNYIFNNNEILSLTGSLRLFGLYSIISALYILLIPAFIRFLGSSRTLIPLSLAYMLTISSMVMLSNNFHWLEIGSLFIQWPFMGIVFLITWILYGLKDNSILYVIITVLFISNATVQMISLINENNEIYSPIEENQMFSLVEDRNPSTNPNIYLLVYDAYVPNETMLAYGINNSPQEEYLQDLGFMLYPHTYSVANFSSGTMSRVLNVSTDFYGAQRRGVSGDGVVQRIFKDLGYKTIGLFPSDYFFRGIDSSYDFSVPKRSSTPTFMIIAILMGEFRFDFSHITQTKEEYVEIKLSILEDVSESPRFIYSHTNIPGHSQNTGVCQTNEFDLYKSKLARANNEMQQDISAVLENDPNAIVIIAGDHGPHLTKNCYYLSTGEYDPSEISRLDIQDRFGTFLAIKWPTDEYGDFDDITILQDIFPAIFAYIYNEMSFLDLKIDSTIISDIVEVQDGIIQEGLNAGEPLYISDN